MSERVEIPLEALVGKTIAAVERDKAGYAVLRFQDGTTLYADDPTAYGDDPLPLGTRVRVRTDLNSGRYNGRTGSVVDHATGSRVVIQLDRFTPGLDSPDGRVWLERVEVEPLPTADDDDPAFNPPEHLADAWRRYQSGEEVKPYELRALDEARADWREEVLGQ